MQCADIVMVWRLGQDSLIFYARNSVPTTPCAPSSTRSTLMQGADFLT